MEREMSVTSIEWQVLVTCGFVFLQTGWPEGKEDSVKHYLLLSLSLPPFGLFCKTGLQRCKETEIEII